MKPASVVFGIAAIGIVASLFGGSNDGYTDIGDGLLMRDDGSVVAAWDLPGCESADDAFDAPDLAVPNASSSRTIWRARYDRGW